MTVRRHNNGFFSEAPPAVAGAVRAVLGRRPPYTQFSEVEEGVTFRTNVRPHWWLLGTGMTIELQSSSDGTLVVVSTESQGFIFGDIFGYYTRYLSDFLRDLRAEVHQQSA